MRMSAHCRSVVVVLALVGLTACDGPRETTSFEPVGPELSAHSSGCDFGRMSQDARRYFPGNGNDSPSAAVQALIGEMEDACSANEADAYTLSWFQVAAVLEDVLAAGTGGAPADGVSFLAQSVSVLRPDESSSIFDPCDGLADCEPWEGADDGLLPDFASVLESVHGAWAVVDSGTGSVCSDFTRPCAVWTTGDADSWGVEPAPARDTIPATMWEDALWNRRTLVFGHPISLSSPTGESQFGSTLPAYEWLLIPYPGEFGSDANGSGELLVTLCSDSTVSVNELMVQKGSTVLTESVQSSWCGPNAGLVDNSSFLQRLASFLSPMPSPLNAIVALGKGPGAGGLASSFTDFYGVEIPNSAVITIPSQPADGFVGQPIMAADGGPLRVLTQTSSMQSPLEKATVYLDVIGNSGLIAAGDSVTAAGLDCEGFKCEGQTLGDQFGDQAGTLLLPLKFTKTGQYSLCFEADLPPLQFGEPVCTEKFNIRP